MPEHKRIVITRWRLSNHRLRIETGRYEVPSLAQHLRLCFHCATLEDENHAIFICPLYETIRTIYIQYLNNYPSIEKVFNPSNMQDAICLGNFLMEIESCRRDLGLE